MSFVYNICKDRLLKADTDFESATLKVLLVITGSNAATASGKDADSLEAIAALGTLGEVTGGGYIAGGETLTGNSVNLDDPNDLAYYDSTDNPVFLNVVDQGSSQIIGAVLYHSTGGSAADHIPLLYIDDGGFPFDGNGGNVTITWNASGIFKIT